MMKIVARIEMTDEMNDEEQKEFLGLTEEKQIAFVDMYKEHLQKLLEIEVDSEEIHVEVSIEK